ncbi:sugar transporter ERD6-like 5 isoform X1 [Tripterygium wilfordii]|uniref:Sugar transporter ERD6-like 5 isoform X1 n=1 Tax=Tripterygium wilfordii TaxID=458696 RepID=A0A7J7D2R2_TRIWF|nr:sugar transporter ERD6-like 17 [Tripterygium wilfordii]KAF5740558.1 sugar transporter ERD6-like 5 isoform X1 [Tripterygium wilfordii]
MEEQGIMEKGLMLKKPLLQVHNHNDHNVTDEMPQPTGDSSSASSSATPSVVFSTFVAVCGSFCYGSALAYSSPAESGIMEDLGLSLAAYSIFGSNLTIGGTVGALACGKIAALIGRKGAMWLSGIFSMIGWLTIAYAKGAWWLYIGRLLQGFGVGITTYVVPVYIAEITPKDIRGTFSFSNQLMVNCGLALVYFIGNDISWRTLALIGAIPCIVQIIGLFLIPESPRWLVKCGKEKDFEISLQRLRGKNVDISQEVDDIRDSIEALEQHSRNTILDLFQRRYAYAIFIGVGLMLLQQAGGSGAISSYASSIFKEADFSTSIGTSAIAIIVIPMGVIGVLLMDVSGRRPLLLASCSGMCLCCFLVALSFFLQEHHQLRNLAPVLAFVSIMGYFAAFSVGIAGIPWIIMSEIFPINVKASAGSLVALVNWSCSWLVTYTFNFMLEWSPAGTFIIFGSVCGSAVLFTWKLVPETKGRTLEEIQASMVHVVQSN